VQGAGRVATSPASPRILRFGAFEFDSRTGELRKQGIRIRLEGQPVAILKMLLERPGELVTREELKKELWPADTFVDFEHSLNAAVKRLRAALNDSADVPRYIETLVGRGYRFVLSVNVVSTAGGSLISGEATPQTASPAPSPAGRLWLWIAAGTLLAAGLGTWGWRAWRHRVPDPAAIPAIRSLAVLPLENLSGDPSQEYFADGMTDALITDLAQISSLRVISRTSSMRYKGARKSLPDIARELDVDAIVEGTVVRSGNHVRVSSQLVYAPLDQHLWAQSYERDLNDVVGLQGDVAREISQAIRVQLTPQERSRFGAHPSNQEAYEAFLKGRYFWSKRTEETTRKAIGYFEQAIEKDPSYGLAFTGLADSYKSLALPDSMQEVLPPNEAFPKARAAAMRALEIDDTLAEAHASLGHIKFLYDRDWAGAEKEFQRAIELNANYAYTRQWYAFELVWMGRLDEARNQLKRAQQLDPLSLTIDGIMGILLSSDHQYDEAIEHCRKPLEMDPDYAFARYRLGQIYVFKGAYAEAIPELEKAVALSGGSPRATAELGLAYSLRGRRDQARKLLTTLTAQSKNRYVAPFDLAMIYGGLGEKSRTLDLLERAAEDRDPSLNFLKLSPAFAGLHSEPRYIALVRRIGLPP
jgi:TolB-like protein/DNA-binding winged helix-turn-helix (wHTH) protein/Flp pilus assembly protein TadD